MKAVIKVANQSDTEYYTDLGTFVRNIYNPEVRLFGSITHAERFLREVQKTSANNSLWNTAKVVGIEFVEVALD
jgi:hypothetical protein